MGPVNVCPKLQYPALSPFHLGMPPHVFVPHFLYWGRQTHTKCVRSLPVLNKQIYSVLSIHVVDSLRKMVRSAFNFSSSPKQASKWMNYKLHVKEKFLIKLPFLPRGGGTRERAVTLLTGAARELRTRILAHREDEKLVSDIYASLRLNVSITFKSGSLMQKKNIMQTYILKKDLEMSALCQRHL